MLTMNTRLFCLHSWLTLLLAFFSFAASAYVSDRVFERLPHLEDEVAYLFQARILARGDLVIATPEPRIAFWQPFVVDRDGRRFGKYTLGWPLQLAAGELLGTPWIVNAWLGAAAVVLVYALGRRMFDRDAALIAAALTAFSPMALLLNATLMGHTSALAFAALFVYAGVRLAQDRRAARWGLLAGIGLGMVIANRSLSAVGIAVPLIAWHGLRVVQAGRESRLRPVLRPLLILTAAALALAAIIPIFNYAAVRDPLANLYTQVWSYDKPGFGECCGRNQHSLFKAFLHARYDLSLTAADLFGWQVGGDVRTAIAQITVDGGYYRYLGLSWALLPFGVWIGLRGRRLLALGWLAIGVGWVVLGYAQAETTFSAPAMAWVWVIASFVWLLLPLVWLAQRGAGERSLWVWLLIALACSVVLVHMTYWVGSEVYSTRYYFEALVPLALISALPLASLARRFGRWIVFGSVVALLVASLLGYSLPRIGSLTGFNNVSRAWIEAAYARQTDGRPLLVIVTGPRLSWRALGSFMAVTSPYLDSEIVAVFNRVVDASDDGLRDRVMALFPDRQVVDLRGEAAEVSFVDP